MTISELRKLLENYPQDTVVEYFENSHRIDSWLELTTECMEYYPINSILRLG